MDNKETILCTVWSDGWNKDMPATLIQYPDGTMDVCIQTGDHFDELFGKAKTALSKIGLYIENEAEENVGCCGAYFRVCKKS